MDQKPYPRSERLGLKYSYNYSVSTQALLCGKIVLKKSLIFYAKNLRIWSVTRIFNEVNNHKNNNKCQTKIKSR